MQRSAHTYLCKYEFQKTLLETNQESSVSRTNSRPNWLFGKAPHFSKIHIWAKQIDSSSHGPRALCRARSNQKLLSKKIWATRRPRYKDEHGSESNDKQQKIRKYEFQKVRETAGRICPIYFWRQFLAPDRGRSAIYERQQSNEKAGGGRENPSWITRSAPITSCAGRAKSQQQPEMHSSRASGSINKRDSEGI